jgi:integrase
MPTQVTATIGPWVEHLSGAGLSPGYIALLRGAITGRSRGFVGVVQALKGPTPTTGQIDHICVDRYLSAHEGGHGSRSNKLQALKSYLGYLERRGLLRPGLSVAKLLEGYKAKREPRKPKYYIPSEDFPALLAVAHDPRDRAALAMALYTLARQGEISLLTLRQAAERGRTIKVYREKRKRWTDSPVGRELDTELETWLKAYADKTGYQDWRQMAAEHPDWYLIPAKHTGPGYWRPKPEVPAERMEGIVKTALTDLGVTETLKGSSVEHLSEGMHTIRRSGARALFKRLVKALGYEGALTFVQAMLDHETQEMTLRYIGMDWVKEQLNEWIIENGMYE